MLVVAAVLILWAHKRRSPSTPWLYYCPVAFLAFSVVQYGNTIWGFQMAWYMVLLSLATTVLLFDRVTLPGSRSWGRWLPPWWAASPLSKDCSFGRPVWCSSTSGAGRCPTSVYGSLVPWHRRFSTFTTTSPPCPPISNFASHHPLAALKFFLFAIGDVVGKPVGLGTSNPDNTIVVLFGLVIVVLAVGTVLICGVRRDERGASPVGIALICYGLLFAALITQGRSYFGYGGASFSRYTTFDLLILVGIYLALLGRPHMIDADQMAPNLAEQPSSAPRRWHTRRAGGWVDRVALPGARVVVLVAIVVQIPLAIHYGVQGARSDYAHDVKAVSVLRNINHSSNSEVTFYLFLFNPASWIREQARTLSKSTA